LRLFEGVVGGGVADRGLLSDIVEPGGDLAARLEPGLAVLRGELAALRDRRNVSTIAGQDGLEQVAGFAAALLVARRGGPLLAISTNADVVTQE
jgi:hypothetical protein